MGGFVRWHMGLDKYGTDSMAKQIVPASHWPEMRILVLVVRKKTFLYIKIRIFDKYKGIFNTIYKIQIYR